MPSLTTANVDKSSLLPAPVALLLLELRWRLYSRDLSHEVVARDSVRGTMSLVIHVTPYRQIQGDAPIGADEEETWIGAVVSAEALTQRKPCMLAPHHAL